ncbi:hypothetical protein L5515_007168 [Caenorhabditis briggsae]|uniref:Uncharacterized protein n=1 Tax=Caenorhabditis briggsae TaxID=6238 RepID=A0AAE9JJ33_CAEBR|nr:hypothetical protein L5515_007168 [Caenorhabditis briggsae]
MMLLMHLCGVYLDLFISALSNQYYVLPAAGHTQGLYTYLGMPINWQGYMYVSGLCLAGVSILGCFENRFTAVFFIAFSIQIITPICAIIGPVGYIAFACATSYFDQALNNIFVNVIAFYGPI